MIQIPFSSVNKTYESTIKKWWTSPALANYQGETYTFGDVAVRMAKLQLFYEQLGMTKGDKIALYSKNQAAWPIAFLSGMTVGIVPVPLLHEFKPANVEHLTDHSESKILFVDEVNWEGVKDFAMPGVKAIILLNDFSLLRGDDSVREIYDSLDTLFAQRYPDGFSAENVNYYEDQEEDLAIINYTSGTSGFSKGVMIPFRAVSSQIEFGRYNVPMIDHTSRIVSMLPCAHMYGLMFEVLYELQAGAFITFLTKALSPQIILKAMAEIRPSLVVAVPLIIEKIYKGKVQPIISKNPVKTLIKIPGIGRLIKNKIRSELVAAFGGQFEEVIVGGAAFNKEVEEFFRDIRFPFTVGYGMTECAPIIAYAHWNRTRLYSCGQIAVNLEAKIDSPDPENIAGEVLVRGANVFQGYYKNPEATEECMRDGWFHTGDMGVMDADGYLYLRGRSKCMFLGPSGQNIYPEEIECVLANCRYVSDVLVVEREGAIHAIVYPDYTKASKAGLADKALEDTLRHEILVKGNKHLPNYSRVKDIEIITEDFERTPKKSIKRYLYK